ncbi:MAG TPA: aldo/keto reductase [Spongiibacteraceae bacterium]|jgi:aryl-alcohol dehydrogenase-like predicted oxidoreductase
MPLNHYVTLGRSGLRVSPLCLGAMTFGEDWGWGASVAESERMLDRYIELGGNFIDTANFYTHGHSEKIIGDYFANDRAKRQRAVIATKFFGTMRPGDPNAGGAGRKNIIWACDESLRRLQTDYIDLYWMHAWDWHTPIEETMRALDDLVSAGKVRYIGISDTPAWKVTQAQMLAQFKQWAPVIALQLEYSLLERTIEGELIPLAKEFGLGITPWSPLKSGALSGKHRRETKSEAQIGRGSWAASLLDERGYDVVETLHEIAKEIDSTPARIAINWVCRQAGVTSPIIGARTLQQLDDNIAALDVSLSAAHLQRLSDLTTPKLNFPAAFLKNSPAFRGSDTTVNGETAPHNPMALKPEQNAY